MNSLKLVTPSPTSSAIAFSDSSFTSPTIWWKP